jgi:hypothetical protein
MTTAYDNNVKVIDTLMFVGLGREFRQRHETASASGNGPVLYKNQKDSAAFAS